MSAQNTRLRILSGSLNKDRLEKTQVEHIEIANEIIKRNYKKAAATLEAHLMASKDAAFNVILSGGFEL
jgi:DNA-binding GntR family transcriptional regulator